MKPGRTTHLKSTASNTKSATPQAESKPNGPVGPGPAAPLEVSMRGFVKELRRIDQLPIGQTFVFLLGAGASVSSGIPGARALAETWLAEMHELDPRHNGIPYHQWMHDGHHGIAGLDPKNAAASYSAIFDRRFAANPSQGFAYLTKLMQDAQPGFGYSVLATLLAKSKHRAVVTTNFDSLVERALLYYTDHTPLTCTDETAAGAFDKDLSCPLIIKCHRDLHLHPHNGVEETSELHANFGQALRSLLPGKVLIVVGYGGNDPSLMGFLEKLAKDDGPAAVYWCYWDKGGLPGARILDWVAKYKGRLVAIPGFDELLSGIKGEFGYELLEQEMERQHKERITRYKGQVEQIVNKTAVTAEPAGQGVDGGRTLGRSIPMTAPPARSDQPSPALASSDALEFASESITKSVHSGRNRKSAWEALLWILPIKDSAAKESAFSRAMLEFPANASLATHYADWLIASYRYADAAQMLDRVIESLQRTEARSGAEEWQLFSKRAKARWLIGNLAGAEADIQETIAWFEAQFPSDQRALAIHYASRAKIRQDRGLLKEAEEDIAKSIAWFEAQSLRDEHSLAVCYAWRASIRQDRGLLKEAEEDLAKAIAWGEAQSPRDERSLAIHYASRASMRQDRGLLKEAEEDLAKSIAWCEAQSPRDERGLAVCYASRASIRQDRGLLKEAEEDIANAIAWFRANQPDNHRRMAINLRTVARVFAGKAEWSKAMASMDEGVAEHEAAFGKDHEWTKKARAWQAAIAAKQVPPRWLETKVE